MDGSGNKQVFWESYPAVNQELTKHISTGDSIDVDVDLGGKGDYATFDINDSTSGWSETYRVEQVNQPTSAEFIDERTEENGKYPLYAHQSVRFLDTYVGWPGDGGTMSTLAHTNRHMYDACGTHMGEPLAVNSAGSYTVQWDAYGVPGTTCS